MTENITTVDPVLNPQVDEQGNPIVPAQAETFVQTDAIVS